MFGHQDENTQNMAQPQAQPVQSGWSQPDPATFAPVAAPQPLLEEHAPDGFTTPQPAASGPFSDAVGDNQLLDIKQQALRQLSPLVGQLEQSPEDKFRTTMMMIQASDNQDLIAVAYEAAQQITDERSKAQALLDVVNEINYFTQH